MIKAHKGFPPTGWRVVRPGFIEPIPVEAPEKGCDGEDGRDGDDGQDGTGISSIEQFGKKLVITLTDGRKESFDLPEGKDGVGIKDVKGHGQDLHFVLTNGDVHKFRLPSQGTPFGGGGGGGGSSSTREPVIKTDTTFPISYAGKKSSIVRLDYTALGTVVRSKAATANLEADWPNRQSLTYTPC